MKEVLVLLLTLSGCMLDTTPDSEVALEEQELIQWPVTVRQGQCVPRSGSWCDTQSLRFEGAWFQGVPGAFNQLTFFNFGPLTGDKSMCAIVRRVNDCNWIEACWAFDSTSGAQVLKYKQNPGQTTRAQCGDNGYTVLGFWSAPGIQYSNQQTHTITVNWYGSHVSMRVDGVNNPTRDVVLPAAVQAFSGPAGVQTFNVVNGFRMDVQ